MQPTIKILLVVWGDAYIDRFAALALPSIMAPGNLPALARESNLEFLILTSASGAGYFEKSPALARLKSHCLVRFITIDDLIAPAMYGVTLTLAYTRGVADSGDAMVDTHFVFLNSDFVLADGSLRTLLARIREGHRCILAPSFRATAEEVEPLLIGAIDRGTDVLVMEPRQMVRIALDHVHPTTVAKLVHQHMLHSVHPNQLYWYLDENTMLGRFFLIFMLCIRPERVVTRMNSYCDYGFVPEMCPSGKVHVLADSDEFFMLETQARLQEGQHLQLGSRSVAQLADRIAEWSTQEHRRAAGYNLLFHSADLAPGTDDAIAQADRYVRELIAHLPPPKDHAGHDYWVKGLQAWREQRRRAGLPANPPEVAEMRASGGAPAARFRQWLSWATQFLLVGARPFLRAWHYDWADYHILAEDLRSVIGNGNRRILVAFDRQTPLAAYFSAANVHVEWTTLERLAKGTAVTGRGGDFDAAICILTPQDLHAASTELFEAMLSLLRHKGELLLLLHNVGTDASRGELTNEIVGLMSRVPVVRVAGVSVRFCGGVLKQMVLLAIRWLANSFLRHGWITAIFGSPLLAVLLLLNLVNNFHLVRVRDQSAHVDYCSSFSLRLKKR